MIFLKLIKLLLRSIFLFLLEPPSFAGTLPTPSAKETQKTNFKIKLVEFSEVNGQIA